MCYICLIWQTSGEQIYNKWPRNMQRMCYKVNNLHIKPPTSVQEVRQKCPKSIAKMSRRCLQSVPQVSTTFPTIVQKGVPQVDTEGIEEVHNTDNTCTNQVSKQCPYLCLMQAWCWPYVDLMCTLWWPDAYFIFALYLPDAYLVFSLGVPICASYADLCWRYLDL